jgi:hypothetical protein
MKVKLQDYLEYEKKSLNPSKEIFWRTLNSLEIKHISKEVNNPIYIQNQNKVKSPYFAWSFGFASLSLAMFMVFLNIKNQTELTNYSKLASNTNQQSTETNTKATLDSTINLINDMNSFENLNVE